MKTVVISYSLSGNNEDLAASLAKTFAADHARITEPGSRKMGKIAFDVLLNRTPKITAPVVSIEDYDLVVFVGPVWMGQIATPFRAYFKQLGEKIGAYAYVSISGGADGPNPKLADELTKRLAKAPLCLVDLHKADLLPTDPAPTRDDTMAYRITADEVMRLTESAASALRSAIAA